MKFVTLIATAVAVSSVSGAAIERRAGGKVCSQYQAEIGTYNTATPINKACVALTNACVEQVDAATTVDNPVPETIWHNTICVAAAACDSTRNLLEVLRCTPSKLAVVPKSLPALNVQVYASITECASVTTCPMTEENFVDLIQDSLTDIDSTEEVTAEQIVTDWWTPLTKHTGKTVSYAKFNDWLHNTAW